MHFLTANRHTAKTTKINKGKRLSVFRVALPQTRELKCSAIRNSDKRIRLPITPFSKFFSPYSYQQMNRDFLEANNCPYLQHLYNGRSRSYKAR